MAKHREMRRRRSPIGEMVLYEDGVIVHTLEEGALIDTRVASQVILDTETLAEGQPVAVVVDLRQVAYADPESREVFAIDPSIGVEVATALVVGPQVAQFLASQWVSRNKPVRDTSIFEDIDQAFAWAAERLRVNIDVPDGTEPSPG